jgi:uncharacterized protein YbcI
LSTTSPGETKRQLQDLTNAMVRLYKEQFGRGPTKSRSDYAGRDVIVCTLEKSMTPAEANMARLGEHDKLRDVRLWFQHVSEEHFTGVVEEITGRKVRGFISGMDTEHDIAAEVFYLEPLEQSNGSATD